MIIPFGIILRFAIPYGNIQRFILKDNLTDNFITVT